MVRKMLRAREVLREYNLKSTSLATHGFMLDT